MLFIFLAVTLFSCTTKEDEVREYVENEVVAQARDYFICQAILEYAQNDAMEVFTNKINYYASNPYYDYSADFRERNRGFIGIERELGYTKKTFDERWAKLSDLYVFLRYRDDVEYGMHVIDTALKFKDLPNTTPIYSIEQIADIYFKPNHMEFVEITPELFNGILRSMLSLGAATYKYDVVDEIRVGKAKEELVDDLTLLTWDVDLVYHSGYCLPVKIEYVNDGQTIGYFVSSAPWVRMADAADFW